MITKEQILTFINYSLIEAAKKLNVSKSTLQRLCKKYNISFAKVEKITPEKLECITPELLQFYANSGKTINEVAKELNISRSALANRLAQFNISFRKVKFDPEKYQNLKKQGLLDKEISEIFKMSNSGMRYSKTIYNLEKEKRNYSEILESEIKNLYIDKKLPISEISVILNKGYTFIYRALKTFNIQIRREDGIHIDKGSLIELYINQKKSISEIAKIFRTTLNSVKKALIRFDLEKKNLISEEGFSLNKFTEIQKQIIYGTILGDAYLSHAHSNTYLKIDHGIKQKDYVEYKYSLLKNFVQKSGITIKKRFDSRTEKFYTAVKFKTIHSKIFTDIYPLFYDSNHIKYLNPKIIEELDARGLTIWYMDDGFKYNQNGLVICTESFLKEDIEKIKPIFKKKWDIDFEINSDNRILFQYENALKFQNLISKYMLPYFNYKLIDVAHQKLIKDKEYANDLVSLPFDLKKIKIKIKDINFSKEEFTEEIRFFIEKYEWLQKVGVSVKWVFTARYQGLLAGVVLINEPTSYSNLLGEQTSQLEALIQRGCSSSWSPKNLGSSLIMFSLRWMAENTFKRIFIGYVDPKASEIGTIYQACNFDYLGNDFGAEEMYQHPYFKNGDFFSRQYLSRTSILKKWLKENEFKSENNWFKENGFKDLSKIPSDIILKWKIWQKKILNDSAKIKIPSKGKYALVLGKDKREQNYLEKLKNYAIFPYPKKDTHKI